MGEEKKRTVFRVSLFWFVLPAFVAFFVPQANAAICSPLPAGATAWSVNLGAQSPDAAKQAMAFLPNEIWIDAGDCVTWTSQTGESHTVTFLKQPETQAVQGNPGPPAPAFNSSSVYRPSFALGCTGGNQAGVNTLGPVAYDGAPGTCVNSGPFCDQSLQQPAGTDPCPTKSFTVQFTNPGNYKLVCLIHSDMTGVVHVLATAAALPHPQDFYDDEARDQAHDLISDIDSPREERNDFPRSSHEVIMTGETSATGGGKQYLAIMRYLPSMITVHQFDTVEWTSLSADEPHTITFLPSGATEPPPAGPGSQPGAVADPTNSGVKGSITNISNVTANGCGGNGGFTCFSSGLIGPANQDQTGLPQTPTGVTRVRITFNSVGTFDYFCTLHDELGMRGEVRVLAPDAHDHDHDHDGDHDRDDH